jgi:hypothetical protein
MTGLSNSPGRTVLDAGGNGERDRPRLERDPRTSAPGALFVYVYACAMAMAAGVLYCGQECLHARSHTTGAGTGRTCGGPGARLRSDSPAVVARVERSIVEALPATLRGLLEGEAQTLLRARGAGIVRRSKPTEQSLEQAIEAPEAFEVGKGRRATHRGAIACSDGFARAPVAQRRSRRTGRIAGLAAGRTTTKVLLRCFRQATPTTDASMPGHP